MPGAGVESRRDLAITIRRGGMTLSNMGKKSAAELEFRKALAIQQNLADDNPAVTDFWSELATSHDQLGWLVWTNGRQSEAESEYRKALAIQQKLVDDNPAVTEFRSNKAEIHLSFGNLLNALGRFVDAEAEFRKELALRQKLADDNPSVPDHRSYIANCLENLIDLLDRTGKTKEALQCADRAVALREQLVKEHPDSLAYRLSRAETYSWRGLALLRSGNIAGAAADWRRGIALYEGLDSIMEPEKCFYRAAAPAALCGLAGQPGSGVLGRGGQGPWGQRHELVAPGRRARATQPEPIPE